MKTLKIVFLTACLVVPALDARADALQTEINALPPDQKRWVASVKAAVEQDTRLQSPCIVVHQIQTAWTQKDCDDQQDTNAYMVAAWRNFSDAYANVVTDVLRQQSCAQKLKRHFNNPGYRPGGPGFPGGNPGPLSPTGLVPDKPDAAPMAYPLCAFLNGIALDLQQYSSRDWKPSVDAQHHACIVSTIAQGQTSGGSNNCAALLIAYDATKKIASSCAAQGVGALSACSYDAYQLLEIRNRMVAQRCPNTP